MIFSSPDEFLTIESLVRHRIKVEGSIFIATAIPVNSDEDTEGWIHKITKEFFDATHNCFAWRIKVNHHDSVKFSDAGEPRGTAGKPILSAIESEKLYNVLVVVTRYFGGVKLGTGGLSRAYRQSAQGALQKADRVTKWITSEMVLSYPLNMTGRVNQVFVKYGVRVWESSFEECVTIRIQVKSSLLETIKKALLDATNGKVRFS